MPKMRKNKKGKEMIHKIHLLNFQSHRDTELEFSPGVNVIIGDSRSGKTAILRALNWGRYNKPAGTALNSYWNRNEKKQPIDPFLSSITFDGGDVVTRKRTADFNGYLVMENSLEAVGQDVPEDVEKIWNMSEVNIQKQFDVPFLISESAAEVARFFNKTIKLDKIDQVLSQAETKRRKLNSEIAEKSEALINLKKQDEELQWIETAEVLIESATRREKRIEEKRLNLHALGTMMITLYELKESIEDYPENIDSVLTAMGKAEELHLTIESKKISADNLDELLAQIDLMQQTIGDCPKNIDEISVKMKEAEELDRSIEQKIDKETALKALITGIKAADKNIKELPDNAIVEKISKDIDSATKIESKIFDAEGKYSKLNTLIFDIRSSEDQVKTFDRALTVFNNQLPDTCVLCGARIDKDTICPK